MMIDKKYTFDENILSDLYKDAYGYRPRSESFWATWNESDDDGKQGIWDGLINELDRTVKSAEQAEKEALDKFEEYVWRAQNYGAATREDAIRWVLFAEGIDATQAAYGGACLCYHFGISFKLADMFQPFCDEIMARENDE